MNALSKIILVTASLQSLSTLSMEPSSSAIQSISLTTENKEALTQLYTLTQYVLSNSESLGQMHSSSDEKSTQNLLAIISETNNLRKKRIPEELIACFAYRKEPSLFENNQSFFNKFENFVSRNNKTSNYHIAVFFKRLEAYNNHLCKNDFTTPTFEQYKNHIANKNIESGFKRAIKKAEGFGILLDETIIHTDRPPFVAIKMNIAAEELDKFINDIKTMCEKNIPLIKTLADLLYLNNQKKETQNNTPENHENKSNTGQNEHS